MTFNHPLYMTKTINSIDGQEGEPLQFNSATGARYVVTCLATGTRVELELQAGQQFTVVRGKSHVKVDVLPPSQEEQPCALEALQAPTDLVH